MLITKDIAAIVSLALGRTGVVFAYPTETFYGLGARIEDAEALQKIIRIKGRDASKGMIVLVADMAMAETLASINADQRALLEHFWPGPLSALLPVRSGVDPLLSIDGKVSLRISPHPLARALCQALGPITSTSANPTGMAPARTADEVRHYNLELDALLDGGPTPGGAPSTLVDLTADPPRCVREGAIAWADVLRRIGAPLRG